MIYANTCIELHQEKSIVVIDTTGFKIKFFFNRATGFYEISNEFSKRYGVVQCLLNSFVYFIPLPPRIPLNTGPRYSLFVVHTCTHNCIIHEVTIFFSQPLYDIYEQRRFILKQVG